MESAIATIAAVSTPPGQGGIAVIRVSGPKAFAIGEQITGKRLKPGALQRALFTDQHKQAIDDGLILTFPKPHSFTGDDVIELQGHGGQVVQSMLLDRVIQLGATLAAPGEFSQRAFINGKMDLTQAEAICDLIESGSESAVRASMRSLQGAFSERVQQLQQQLIHLRSYTEAALDFAEEEIDFLDQPQLRDNLNKLHDTLQSTLSTARQGARLNQGIVVAIAGRPNAGKSSLINHLSGYDAAIVSDIPGTTRDIVKEQVVINGVPVQLIDTAGLRETGDSIETEGIRRAWQSIEQADAIWYLVDASYGENEEDREFIKQLDSGKLTLIYSKSDLVGKAGTHPDQALALSVVNETGIQQLKDALVTPLNEAASESTFSARQRHINALEQAFESVNLAQKIFEQTGSGELMAEDLKQAQKALSKITGEYSQEDLLGDIFSSFCIGK